MFLGFGDVDLWFFGFVSFQYCPSFVAAVTVFVLCVFVFAVVPVVQAVFTDSIVSCCSFCLLVRLVLAAELFMNFLAG